MHVVIGRVHWFQAPRHAPPRKWADLHLGLGVERNPQRLGLLGGLGVNLIQVREDRVRGGNFF
jgi:hypothetical protein